MSNQNLRKYFSEIQEKFAKGIKDADENFLEQIKMDIELLKMISERVREMKKKKEAIENVQASIKARTALIGEFTELISSMSDQFKALDEQATKKNCFIYSPYNNTKPLSSFEILNYAKKISHSLQAPKNYEAGAPIPINFVIPFPIEDIMVRSYIYYNSRTDGKVPTKCLMPSHGITNKIDIVNSDGKSYHMRRSASVIITANDPKDCSIAYTVDGSVPTPFSERQMGNGETIEIPDSCVLKVMACKYGYLDSDILELEFNIDRVEDLRDPNMRAGVVNAEFAQRPDILADTKISGGIEFLDTPYSMGRTPSYMFTPSYTPSYREPSTKDQGDH